MADPGHFSDVHVLNDRKGTGLTVSQPDGSSPALVVNAGGGLLSLRTASGVEVASVAQDGTVTGTSIADANGTLAAQLAAAAATNNATYVPLTTLNQLPTLEEISGAVRVGTVSATATALLAPALFDQRIGSFYLANTAAMAASDTDYWTVDLIRYRAGEALTIATKTTKTTGGAAVSAAVSWTFDLVTWSAARRLVQTGDILAVTFTATGSPTAWAETVAGWRFEPGVTTSVSTVIASDNFNRAESATTLGTTPVGAKTWTNLHGGGSLWGISSNQAYLATVDGTNRCSVVIDTVSDCTMSLKLVVNQNSGFVTRMTTDTNGFLSNASQFFRWQAGALTAICTFSSSYADGDVMSVEMSGPNFTFYKNGVYNGACSDTFNQTATKHGFKSNTNSAGRFDDFSITTTS